MAKITLPTVHLNGTSAEELLGQVTQAAKKIHEAMAALANASPHGRDYYPQGDRAFTFADLEHLDRMNRLRSVYDELFTIAESITDQDEAK